MLLVARGVQAVCSRLGSLEGPVLGRLRRDGGAIGRRCLADLQWSRRVLGSFALAVRVVRLRERARLGLNFQAVQIDVLSRRLFVRV